MKISMSMRGRAMIVVCLTTILAFTASCADPESNPAAPNTGKNPPPDFISGTRIFGHSAATLAGLADADVVRAKSTLHISYGHTSHGSQLMDGLGELDAFKEGNGLYAMQRYEEEGSLHLSDTFMANDVGYYPDWVTETRTFLGTVDGNGRGSAHPEFNVIMWSWCGQLSWYTAEQVSANYLEPMAALEADYPGIRFVYMTGHADGTGLAGTLHLNNERIRQYCAANNKWLYDFNDIENWDPDGVYYGGKNVDDACDFDGTDENGNPARINWAQKWQAAHPGEWYQCGSAHSEPLNANRKAYAAWQLFAAVAKSFE